MQFSQNDMDTKCASLLLSMKESKLYWKVRSQLLQDIMDKARDSSQVKNVDIVKLSSQSGLEQ